MATTKTTTTKTSAAKATKERKPTMKKQTTTTTTTTTKPNTELITAYLITAVGPNNPKAYITAEGKQKIHYTNKTQADGLVYKDITISQGYQLLFKTANNDHFIIHINTFEETSKSNNTYRSANIFLGNAINQLNPDRHLYLDNDQELTDLQVKSLINKLYKKPINFSKTQVSGTDYFNYRIEQPAPVALPFKLI
jgi:hypothetical protein